MKPYDPISKKYFFQYPTMLHADRADHADLYDQPNCRTQNKHLHVQCHNSFSTSMLLRRSFLRRPKPLASSFAEASAKAKGLGESVHFYQHHLRFFFSITRYAAHTNNILIIQHPTSNIQHPTSNIQAPSPYLKRRSTIQQSPFP
ncbi:MAG: hypothetical protein ACI837_002223 [Crocinitomicaceae bacterium]|jgi:hypothetical protein